MTAPVLVVVMGVAGSGKSHVGAALAHALHRPFAEGDDFHSAANVAKMSRGDSLTDEDRWPWLDAIGAWLDGHQDGGVATCSALRRAYRDRLRSHAPALAFCQLTASRDMLVERMRHRSGHFMPASLLDSQLATLEPLATDERGVIVDVAGSPDSVVRAALTALATLPPR